MPKRVISWVASTYLIFFATIMIYGKLVYGFLSNVHPNQSLTYPPGAYRQYAAYAQFLDISIIILALLLGVWAALLGLARKSYLLGIGALFTGITITALGFLVLPEFIIWGLIFSLGPCGWQKVFMFMGELGS